MDDENIEREETDVANNSTSSPIITSSSEGSVTKFCSKNVRSTYKENSADN